MRAIRNSCAFALIAIVLAGCFSLGAGRDRDVIRSRLLPCFEREITISDSESCKAWKANTQNPTVAVLMLEAEEANAAWFCWEETARAYQDARAECLELME